MVYIMSNFYTKKKHLKANGLADASVKECRQVKPDKNSWKEKDRQFKKKIADKMHKDNVLHALPNFLRTVGVLKD